MAVVDVVVVETERARAVRGQDPDEITEPVEQRVQREALERGVREVGDGRFATVDGGEQLLVSGVETPREGMRVKIGK